MLRDGENLQVAAHRPQANRGARHHRGKPQGGFPRRRAEAEPFETGQHRHQAHEAADEVEMALDQLALVPAAETDLADAFRKFHEA